MYRELARKQPAKVVKAEPMTKVEVGNRVMIRDRLRTVVSQEVHRLYAEGRIEQNYRIGRDPNRGVWVAQVVYRAERHSWLWRHWVKLTAFVLVGSSIIAGLIMILKLLIAALVMLIPVAIGFSVLLFVLALLRGGGREVIVEQKVRVRG